MQQTREHQRLVFLSREPTQWMMPMAWAAAVAQDDLAAGRAGGVDQALDLQRGVDVRVEAVAVLRDALGVEGLEAGGDDDVPTLISLISPSA
jgi:hypothetical protein